MIKDLMNFTLDEQIRTLQKVRNELGSQADQDWVRFVERLQPLVGFTGVGKSGHVARRAAATWTSCGLTSVYVDANEAAHGDLGTLRSCSTVVLLSQSGMTDEVLRVAAELCRSDIRMISVGAPKGHLRHYTDFHLDVVAFDEGDVPSASLAGQSAWCDALLTGWRHLRDPHGVLFKANHPGGAIGERTRT